MTSPSPKEFWRLRPSASTVAPGALSSSAASIELPQEFIQRLRPRHGITLASWDAESQLGKVEALGVVRKVDRSYTSAEVDWRPVEISFHPNPSGRRWWTQAKPFFGYAKDVAERYLLEALFAEHFPEFADLEFGSQPPAPERTSRPSSSPTGGYVYVIRSKLGFKIGKTVNLRSRTRLFAVRLPFPTSVEYYAWFEDYTHAERSFHLTYHTKRLEGEWFDLSESDLETIKSQGQCVPVVGL
jgi:Meiotically up-regulated gene 113